MEYINQINTAAAFIQSRYEVKPQVGIILGSGLGNFSSTLQVQYEIPYQEIPFFPTSTVEGHQGKLLFATIEKKQVVIMAGRFHYYEGYSAQEVVFPVRVMRALGIELLMLSNAAGGMNVQFKIGDIMVISDQISLFTPNPLIGKNESTLGPRFPDLSEPYQRTLIQLAKQIAHQAGIKIHEGVYCAVTGPTFETKAEYRLLSAIGADAVGMSTVQEVIAAAHMQLPCFGISVITDLGTASHEAAISHEEVLIAAKAAEPQLTFLFTEIIKAL